MFSIDAAFVHFYRSNLKSVAGFSLLEIMCALIIMSMLTSFSVTRWQIYQQKLQLDNASRSLMAFLMQVQFSANQLNRHYQVNFTEPSLLNILEVIEQDGHELITIFDMLKQEKSIVLSSANVNTPIVFYGKRNMASAGHFSVANALAEVRVIVSARGRIRRCVQPNANNDHPIMGIRLC